MSWNVKSVDEITEVVTKGTTPSTYGMPFANEGINFVKAEALNGDVTLDRGGFTFIKDETHEKLKRSKLQQDDVLVTIAGANVGKCGFVRSSDVPANTNQAVGIVRVKKEEANPRFVYYHFRSPRIFAMCQGIGGGQAAQPNINLTTLKSFKINMPDLETQARIVDFIGVYDDLIENNKRRIELLEESARQLYKEWFVRFRFPGHEHVRVVDGMPEGWRKLKISDLCTVGRGASPRPIQNYMDGEIPWFKIADATASESAFIFETREKVIESGAQKSVFLQEGELILSNSATCGVPNFTGVKGCIHDGWLYFKGLKTVDKWFLYLYLVFQQKALLQGIGEGATQKNLNTIYVGNQIITTPDSAAFLQSFSDLVEPVFTQIGTLASYSRKLSQARDLLLPKLMNGEITV